MDSSFDVEKLTYEIFSILENKFLFDDKDNLKKVKTSSNVIPDKVSTKSSSTGKIRILSIDGRGTTDGILAAKSLSLLEASIQHKTNDPDARIADFFDVAAGSGVGGIIAALLFTKGKHSRPIFTAKEALNFLTQNRRKLISSSSPKGLFGRIFRHSNAAEKLLRRTFGESTLKDTLKPILIPCYDLSTRAPFLFSRADALETDSYDFMMREVCLATTSIMFQMKSIDKRTNISAVDGGVAMNNPTAAAITHVLNNKQEFPFCNGVQDFLVASLGNGESDSGNRDLTLSPSGFIQIVGEGASDMVDQAVSMAFGESMTSNYVRIQGNGFFSGVGRSANSSNSNSDGKKLVGMAENMLAQKNVESVLFKGKNVNQKTNLEKLELFGGEVIKENERRKTSIFPTVLFKQVSPRTSSATISSISSTY